MQEYSRAGRGSGLDGGLCAGPEAWLARCEQHPLICMGHKDLRESGPSLPLSPLVSYPVLCACYCPSHTKATFPPQPISVLILNKIISLRCLL